MSRICHRSARGEAAPRASLYDEVTNRIIAELEAGRFPWVQPWGKAEAEALGPGLPRNAATGRHYSGVNILILWGEVIARSYPSQSWLTFRQALDAGGSVRKGEKGVTVVHADRFVPNQTDQTGLRGSAGPAGRGGPPENEMERARETGEDAKAIPFLKRFTVFNVAQCEGLREGLAGDPVALPEREMVPVAEELIAASGADVRIGGPQAYYAPGPDFVAVPLQQAFFSQVNFYRTALHELTHWTGHASRLARDFSGAFGSAKYAREELVAEMGAAFLSASLGIVPTVRHADYLAGWLEVLRGDNRAIFRAASAASKAADYLIGLRDRARESQAA